MKKRKLHDNDFTDNNKGHADVDNEGSNGAAQNNNPISGNTCLLYVRNLPFDANERSIGEFFLPGIMTRLNRNTNAKRTGRLSGSSFVEMSTAAAASKAVAKSGQWPQTRL
jgi:RNA recognition motif-containing protein